MTILNLFILILILISFPIFIWGWILFLRKKFISYAFDNVFNTGGTLRFLVFYAWVAINTTYLMLLLTIVPWTYKLF